MPYSFRDSSARPSIELFGTSSRSFYQPGITVGQGLGLDDEVARMEDEGETVSQHCLLTSISYVKASSGVESPETRTC